MRAIKMDNLESVLYCVHYMCMWYVYILLYVYVCVKW